jgi:hypothetical protein
LKATEPFVTLHSGILHQMLHLFPVPPESVTAAWDPLAILDSDGFDADSLLHESDRTAVEELLGPPPTLKVEVTFLWLPPIWKFDHHEACMGQVIGCYIDVSCFNDRFISS